MNISNIIFTKPEFMTERSAWHEHTPFAFFLMEKLRPDVFVELGTYYGYSYGTFCQAIKMLGLPTKAYAVDTFSGDAHSGHYSREAYNHLIKISDENFSHFSNLLNTTFDAASELFEAKSVDLLHIDGLHTYAAVKHDFEHWLPKMSDKGVIIFHDTAVKTGDFGVWELMAELSEKYPYFEFPHGYGLGVLCTGKNVDLDFLAFLEQAAKDPFIPELFHQLGVRNVLESRIAGLENEIRARNRELESMNQEIEHLTEQIRVQTITITKQKQIAAENAIQSNHSIREENTVLASELSFPNGKSPKKNGKDSWKFISQIVNSNYWFSSQYTTQKKNLKILENSELFDRDFYLGRNPDVRSANLDPVQHYLQYGGFEGRDPSSRFCSDFYLGEYPDVRDSKVNPLLHYLIHGWKEGRKTFPEASTEEVSRSETQPEVLREPAFPEDERELIRKSGLFSEKYYLACNPDVMQSGIDPLEHFLEHGWSEKRNPNPSFDSSFYLYEYPDVRENGMNPLVHYILYGQAEGRKTTYIPEIPNEKDKLPTVMVVSGESRTPGHYYRVVNLLASLAELGIPATWTTPENLESQLSVLDQVRIVILWRTLYSSEIEKIIIYARKSGCLVVFDIDDLMFDPGIATPEQMDAIRSLNRKQSDIQAYCSRMQTTALQSDLCLATTREIADGFGRLGKKCFVVPNGYSRESFRKSAEIGLNRPGDPSLIRIGYAGGTLTHQRDFALAIPAIIRILNEFPHARLTTFAEVLNFSEFPELAGLSRQIETRAMVPYPDLMYEIVRFDINIAPLENTDFCNAKSELKFFEAALLGIPTIASPAPPFKRVISHGTNGFISNSDEDWYESLRLLVTDSTLRETIGRNAFTSVRWHFGPDERNLLIDNFLTWVQKEFPSNFCNPGQRHFFVNPDPNIVKPAMFKTSNSPLSFRKDIQSQTVTGKYSKVGILVWVDRNNDQVLLLLDSLTRQTFDGIDLIICCASGTSELRLKINQWQKVNRQRFNRIAIAETLASDFMPDWLNFSVEDLKTEYFAVVVPDSYLLPETIGRFVEIVEVSGAAGAMETSPYQPEGFTLFRSAFILREGGFDSIGHSIPDVTEKMAEKLKLAGDPFVQVPGIATIPAQEKSPRGKMPQISVDLEKTILFIGHDDARAGAEVVLLSIMRWFRENLNWKMILLLINCKNVLIGEFEKISDVVCLEKYFKTFGNPLLRRCALAGRIGPVDLVYGNTVLSANVTDEISFLQAPVLFHIHEMESVIGMLLDARAVRNLHCAPEHFISCSRAVTENLQALHTIKPEKITTIEAFVGPPLPGSLKEKKMLRRELNWGLDTFIVLGCGSINYRKGVDLFIKTADAMLGKGFQNFRFIWIGALEWDFDAFKWSAPSWEQQLREISNAGWEERVTFLGPVANIYDYMPAADLFYLPSREDPFPLVVLEASLAGVPSLCFSDCGGIPRAFGEEAILTVGMSNYEEAAQTIIQLSEDQERIAKYGKNAQKLVMERFTATTALPRISSVCDRLISRETVNNPASESQKNTPEPFRWVFVTTNDGSPDGGSEKLWVQSAISCREEGDEVAIVIRRWEPEPPFIDSLISKGVKIICKAQDPFGKVHSLRPDLVVISTGDQNEGVEWFDFCNMTSLHYVIINHLTKEPSVWPVVERFTSGLRRGYLGARKALFTGRNNLRLMERRLGCPIPASGIFFNPTDVERFPFIPFPETINGWQLAMVGALLDIHKGQKLAISLMNLPRWRARPVTLNIYGKGPDEEEFRKLVTASGIKNVVFHGHVSDIHGIWKMNHALLMSSYMEGLPLVLIAAMMCGRVPVVTDIGAHTEVIADNETGFIAKTPSLADFDEALERAWNRREEWADIGEKASAFIHQYIPEDPVGHFVSTIRPTGIRKNTR